MNNPPAFPLESHWVGELRHLNGMSLRDYFAAKAMQALVEKSYFDTTARLAYEIADAMLAAREKA